MIFEESRYESATLVAVPDSTGAYHATIMSLHIPSDAGGTYNMYRTVFGDTFWSIAAKAYNDPEFWWYIADANPVFFFPDNIPAGSLIMVPAAPPFGAGT